MDFVSPRGRAANLLQGCPSRTGAGKKVSFCGAGVSPALLFFVLISERRSLPERSAENPDPRNRRVGHPQIQQQTLR
jgi:hypothetical protein